MIKFVKLLRNIKTVLFDICTFFITYLPSSTGRKLRYVYWKRKFKKCGKNVIIGEGVIIQNPECISIGDNVWKRNFCVRGRFYNV